MSTRKPIPNKTRFEVFKRDSFTCQYCGCKAPDVVLNVDHISPVSSGGDNNITNLVTSCFSCNSGKRDRLLSDNAVIAKQQAQLEALNERRQQLEMMVQWREELLKLDVDTAQAFADYIEKLSGFGVNDLGLSDIKKWLKQFSFEELCDAAQTSFSQYGAKGDSGTITEDSWHKAFGMLVRIASVNKSGGMDQNKKRAYYVRGILRNRLHYVSEKDVMPVIFTAMEHGVDVEDIVLVSKHCSSWTNFQDLLWKLIGGNK